MNDLICGWILRKFRVLFFHSIRNVTYGCCQRWYSTFSNYFFVCCAQLLSCPYVTSFFGMRQKIILLISHGIGFKWSIPIPECWWHSYGWLWYSAQVCNFISFFLSSISDEFEKTVLHQHLFNLFLLSLFHSYPLVLYGRYIFSI